MSLPNTYSLKTTSIPLYFEGMLKAAIPDTFDAAFMARLGFHYAIDRSFIDILKELHFLSDAGMPTKRYFDFHGRTAAKQTLLDGIHEAYSKLFDAQPDAPDLPDPQLLDRLKELYAGKKSDMMVSGIARTFTALYRYATQTDFTPTETTTAEENAAPDTTVTPEASHTAPPAEASPSPEPTAAQEPAVLHPEPEATIASDEPEPLVLVLEPETEATAPHGETPPLPEAALPPQPAATPAEPLTLGLELETEPEPPIDTRTTPPLAPEEILSTAAPVTQTEAAPAVDAVSRPESPPAEGTPEAEPAACAPRPQQEGQSSDAGTAGDTAHPGILCLDNGTTDSRSCPIQIVLPTSSDIAVYDAIFSSLKRNLLATKK